MAGFFDYTPQKSALDVTSGLNNLGDALTDVLNRRQKQKEIDAKMALDQTQQAINNRKANEDTLRFKRETQQDQSKAQLSALSYIGQGNPQAANVAMHGAGGEAVPGPIADVGPAPSAPGPAPSAPAGVPPEIAARRKAISNTAESPYKSNGQPMPPQYGVDPLGPQVITDDGKPPSFASMRDFSPEVQGARYQDTKDMIAEEQAGMDAKKFGADKADYDQRAAAFPQQQADYQTAKTAAERDRPYTLRFGGDDPGVKVDVATQRDGMRRQNADDFLASLDGLQLDDNGKQAARAAHSEILAGADPKAAIRSFQQERVGLGGQAFKHGENQFHEQEADKRAAMMGGSRGTLLDIKAGELGEHRAAGNRADRGNATQAMRDWETNTAGLSKDAGTWKRLRMSLQNLNSNNPVAQQDGVLGLASVFRGGNTATKDVTENVRAHLSGLGGRAEGVAEGLESGQLGAEQRANAARAAQLALREHDEQLRLHEQSFRDRFGPGSGYENQGALINHEIKSVMAEHGLDAAPVYDDADPARGALGSNRRPYQGQPKGPKRAPGAPPEVKAKDKAKADALDAAMQ